MFRAVDAYRRHFGEAPPTWRFMGRPEALARELRTAVARGQPVTVEDLYRRLDLPPPPPDAKL